MKRPRVLNIVTPTRKKAVVALSRRCDLKAAKECLANEKVRSYIISKVGFTIRKEIKLMSTFQSVLRSELPDLKNFKWDMIYNELQQKAPIFLSFLLSATHTRVKRSNRIAVICVCTAVLLKYRFRDLNMVQKILSLMFYSCHASKEVKYNDLLCTNYYADLVKGI